MPMPRKAFSILEAVIALALFMLILVTLGAYASFSLANLSSQQAVIEARALSQEASSVLALIAARDWSEFKTSVSSLSYDNNEWNLVGPGIVEQRGIYQRTVRLMAVCRDAQQALVDCSLGIVDPGTYQVLISIDWSDWLGAHEFKQETYISQWR